MEGLVLFRENFFKCNAAFLYMRRFLLDKQIQSLVRLQRKIKNDELKKKSHVDLLTK